MDDVLRPAAHISKSNDVQLSGVRLLPLPFLDDIKDNVMDFKEGGPSYLLQEQCSYI